MENNLPGDTAWPGHDILKTHRRHVIAAYVVAGVGIALAVLFAILWFVKGKSQYHPVFEGMPSNPNHVLQCPDDPQVHWAQTGGKPTTMCVFSGDMTLPGGKAVSEQEVIDKCNARTDCGGYTVRTTSSYEPCPHPKGSSPAPHDGTVSGCVKASYNSGQPEYMLYSYDGMRSVRQTSRVVQGANNEVRTVTHVRMS